MRGMGFVLGALLGVSLSAQGANLGRTLFIGDSLSMDGFGETVLAELGRYSSSYSFYAACGSKPNSWVRQPSPYITNCGYWARDSRGAERKIPWSRFRPKSVALPFVEDMLRAEAIDTIIVQLGLNMLDSENLANALSSKYVIANVQSFVRALKADPVRQPKRCYWIAPHRTTRWSAGVQEQLFEILRTQLQGSCQVVDGRLFTKNSRVGSDGYHLHGADARRFASEVFGYIRN